MQTQRGFVSAAVLIAIVLGLIVVGGGAYYVVNQQSTSQTASENFDNVQALPTNNQPQQPQTTANTSAAATTPTCSLTVKTPTITKTNISGTNNNFEIAQGQSATISWTTTNADYGGVVESGKFPSGEAGTILASGSGSVSPTMNTTYLLKFEGKNGQVKCGATIKIIGGAPSATVDKNSLIDTSGTPTLSGTATNVTEVAIQVAPKAKIVGGEFISAKVVNGRWSAPFSTYVAPLVSGEYTVIIRTLDSNVLATETLSVNTSAANALATFNHPSDGYTFTYDGKKLEARATSATEFPSGTGLLPSSAVFSGGGYGQEAEILTYRGSIDAAQEAFIGAYRQYYSPQVIKTENVAINGNQARVVTYKVSPSYPEAKMYLIAYRPNEPRTIVATGDYSVIATIKNQ